MLNLPRLNRAHKWLLWNLEAQIDNELQLAGQLGVQAAKGTDKFKGAPGPLRNATAMALKRMGRRRRVALLNRHPGAWAQDKGSGLFGPRRSKYPIRARRAKTLRFTSGGSVVFRRMVWHPGVRPTHFLFDANTRAFERAGLLLNLRMRKLAKEFRRK